MAISWSQLGQTVNTMFAAPNRANTGQKFRLKHGHNGHGTDPGTVPYRFGLFAVDSVQASNQPRWLIDTGTRHWDNTITDIENAVRDSLTQPPGQEYQMIFDIQPDAPGATASAVVVKTTSGGQTVYNVTIHCPP